MFNHPVHPVLVHFPIGAWGIATGLDILAFAGLYPEQIWPAATGLVGIGLVFGLVAMAGGGYDLYRLSVRQNHLTTRASYHAMIMLVVWCLYLTALMFRVEDGALAPLSAAAVIISLLGFLGLLAGGWLGGDLVYRFGANVEPVQNEGGGDPAD